MNVNTMQCVAYSTQLSHTEYYFAIWSWVRHSAVARIRWVDFHFMKRFHFHIDLEFIDVYNYFGMNEKRAGRVENEKMESRNKWFLTLRLRNPSLGLGQGSQVTYVMPVSPIPISMITSEWAVRIRNSHHCSGASKYCNMYSI